MQVGVNYPWRDYGWDFGLGPPQWRGERLEPTWYAEIDEHLRHFRGLGITVVRWFILADGLTYGHGIEAPQPGVMPEDAWQFDPPPLGEDCLQHFDELLQRFASANSGADRPIQLLPVLIDFHFCEPGVTIAKPDAFNPQSAIPDPDWVKQGRSAVVNDPRRRREFLDRALDPLLRAAAAEREAVYAFELVNEPDWITNGWHPDRRMSHPVSEPAMRAFLDEGKMRIRAAGLKPTIGFASIDTLRHTAVTAEINQFHHYPAGVRPLGRHVFDARFPGIIGELATAPSDAWPELVGREQSVLNRLRLAEAQGYPLAIPWSFLAHDRHTAWTPEVEADLRSFALRPQEPLPPIA